MKRIFIAFLCAMTLFGVSGCSGSPRVKVDKKTTVEYTPKEVKEIFERNGYEILRNENSYIKTLGVDVQPLNYDYKKDSYITAFKDQGEDTIYISYVTADSGLYSIDVNNEKDDASVLGEGDSTCVYNVELNKDETENGECGKLSIEDSEKLYVDFYGVLNELNISRQELIDFLVWEMEINFGK